MPTGIYPRTIEHRDKIARALLGKQREPFTDVHKENIRKAKLGNNHAYKGDDVGYHGLHRWVIKHLGQPLECSHCRKAGGTTRNYHWANISHAYKRQLSDWARLCVSCHKLYDLGKLALS